MAQHSIIEAADAAIAAQHQAEPKYLRPQQGALFNNRLRACGNQDCEWEGVTDRYCGTVGPLCPDCGDITEPAA